MEAATAHLLSLFVVVVTGTKNIPFFTTGRYLAIVFCHTSWYSFIGFTAGHAFRNNRLLGCWLLCFLVTVFTHNFLRLAFIIVVAAAAAAAAAGCRFGLARPHGLRSAFFQVDCSWERFKKNVFYFCSLLPFALSLALIQNRNLVWVQSEGDMDGKK